MEDNCKYMTSVVMNNWQEVVLHARDWTEGYQLLTMRNQHMINITQCCKPGEILWKLKWHFSKQAVNFYSSWLGTIQLHSF